MGRSLFHEGTSTNKVFRNTVSRGVVLHAFNLGTWEAEVITVISRPAWPTQGIPGQLLIHSETLSQIKKKKNKRKEGRKGGRERYKKSEDNRELVF